MCQAASTPRLFPRGKGAPCYHITGIAARCDWVVLTDLRPPRTKLVRHRSEDPRHVFLSMRDPHLALTHFADQVLPQITAPFVLVTGSEDATVPNQDDARWRRYNERERDAIGRILANPLLLRWFAENLDDPAMPKMRALPVGMTFPDGEPDRPIRLPEVPPLSERPMRVLCAHRMREGPQWDLRRRVTALAREHWSDWTTILEEEVPEEQFLRLVEQHAFVLCVEGGGVDPSPKAWHTLMHGAIPIIRSPGMRQAYARLPTVILDDWNAEAITPQRLAAWRDERVRAMDSPEGRQALQRHLTLDHWWEMIASAAR